jgi:hypothetical protein
MEELMPAEPGDYASKFMLQEYTRIIDAYHDLHRQKDSLIKFYLAFVSLPVSIVGIFLALSSFLQSTSQSGSAIPPEAGSVLEAIQSAGVFLSILLVFVGASVLMVMLRIREEQYLYVKTINGVRKFFKDKGEINADAYLVLPSELSGFTFGHAELSGRAFWEAMIVSFTTCMLLGFLASELLMHIGIHGYCILTSAAIVSLGSLFGFVLFIQSQLRAALRHHKLSDVETT